MVNPGRLIGAVIPKLVPPLPFFSIHRSCTPSGETDGCTQQYTMQYCRVPHTLFDLWLAWLSQEKVEAMYREVGFLGG